MNNDGPSITERVALFMAAMFLFGLAVLFMLNLVWPGILVLVWLTVIPILLVDQGWLGLWVVAQMTIWMIGLPFLVATNFIFPGILVLAGASTLLTAIAHPSKLDEMNKQRRAMEKVKRKRTLPVPPDAFHAGDTDPDDENDEYDWSLHAELNSSNGHHLRRRR